MTLDDIKELMRVQLPPIGDVAAIAGLRVSPDVWAELVATLPKTVDTVVWGWNVTVDEWLPRGTIVPVDREGKPVPKPRPAGQVSGGRE